MEHALRLIISIILTSVGLLLFFSALRVKSVSIGGVLMIVDHSLHAVDWCYLLPLLLSCCELSLIHLAESLALMRGKFLWVALQRKLFFVSYLQFDVLNRGLLHRFQLFFIIFALVHWLLKLVAFLFGLYLLLHEIEDSRLALWLRLLPIILHLGYRLIHKGISWWLDIKLWRIEAILLRLLLVFLMLLDDQSLIGPYCTLIVSWFLEIVLGLL